MNEKNWAGNITYSAARLYTPDTVAQLQEIIRSSIKLRALGSRHSFNRIADTDADLVSTAKLNRVLKLDVAKRTVTVEAGIKYGELCGVLEQAGLALHNLASLPHISVAGACATATHGSGVGNGNLATVVSAMELVTADGQVVECSRARDGDKFYGMVVGLGALGVVTKMTLDLLPSFAVRQDIYENLPLAQVQSNYEAIMSSGYSVSLFTDWQDERFTQVWRKRRVTNPATADTDPTFFGATPAPTDRHPITALSSVNCTAQMGVPGPWYERLPHFRMDFTPSSGEELQTEYFVSQHDAVNAINAVAQLAQKIAPLLMVSEIRTIAADDFWMSPCYQEACTALHFTWLNEWDKVRELLPLIEAQLAPFNARPHWGKLFTMPASQVQARYSKLADFRALAQSLDPRGKFRNAFVDEYIFPKTSGESTL